MHHELSGVFGVLLQKNYNLSLFFWCSCMSLHADGCNTFSYKNIEIMLISFYIWLNFVILRIDNIFVLIYYMRCLNIYFNVKYNTSIQNMYICFTAAATQIYSNVGGNLRQAFCCSICSSDALYRDSRPWKKWAHNIKVYYWTLWMVSKIYKLNVN